MKHGEQIKTIMIDNHLHLSNGSVQTSLVSDNIAKKAF